jgi:hypothetical protein
MRDHISQRIDSPPMNIRILIPQRVWDITHRFADDVQVKQYGVDAQLIFPELVPCQAIGVALDGLG